MTTKEQNLLLEKVDERVMIHKMFFNLFCGGCCFAAAVIAKHLEEKNIKYRVVSYQESGFEKTRLNNVVKNGGVVHIAIEVVYKHTRVMIGESCDNMMEEYELDKVYRKLNSHQLMKIYDDNMECWNERYDTSNNYRFEREMTEIFNQF